MENEITIDFELVQCMRKMSLGSNTDENFTGLQQAGQIDKSWSLDDKAIKM